MFALVCTVLPVLALGAATALNVSSYDAIVVGGGPAGLSALSGLARVRRNVLLIDSGVYRNELTRHVHDLIGLDGVTPAYYRWRARDQLRHYPTVNMINGTVTSITAVGDANDTSFTVVSTLPGCNDTQTLRARKVVLATGLVDDLPSTPGIAENWSRGIYWCAWCDGYEHADQPLGLLGSLTSVPATYREITTQQTDVVAFVNGTDTPEQRTATSASFPDWEGYLRLHNVTVDNRTIAAIVRLRDGGVTEADPSLPTAPEYDLFRVDFAEGASVERAAFLASWNDHQASDVGQKAGVQLWGGRLAVDPTRGLVTNIPGIYAVGDANSDNVTNVPHALFSGKRTAVYLHVQIAREDATAELANSTLAKRDELDMGRLWERVNADDDVLDARMLTGRFGSL